MLLIQWISYRLDVPPCSECDCEPIWESDGLLYTRVAYRISSAPRRTLHLVHVCFSFQHFRTSCVYHDWKFHAFLFLCANPKTVMPFTSVTLPEYVFMACYLVKHRSYFTSQLKKQPARSSLCPRRESESSMFVCGSVQSHNKEQLTSWCLIRSEVAHTASWPPLDDWVNFCHTCIAQNDVKHKLNISSDSGNFQ
jgi:hypothetical protein